MTAPPQVMMPVALMGLDFFVTGVGMPGGVDVDVFSVDGEC